MARSIKKNKYEIKKLKTHIDIRGWFLEIAKNSEMGNKIKQVSIASIKPGKVRGNHYHNKKHDWFFVFGGRAEFFIGEPNSEKVNKIIISEECPVKIHVLPGATHAVKNVGKKVIYFVEVVSEEYNHKKPDVVSHIICK